MLLGWWCLRCDQGALREAAAEMCVDTSTLVLSAAEREKGTILNLTTRGKLVDALLFHQDVFKTAI